jgi:hypothetical protein
MGLLVSDNPARSVVAMRLVAWSVAVSIIVAAAVVAESWLRGAYVMAVFATSVPLGLFLFASNNPSGWAIAGIGAFWCAACAFLTTTCQSRIRWSAAVGVLAAALALVSRADAGLYIVITIGSTLLFTRGWQRERLNRSIAVLVVAMIAAAVFVSRNQAAVATAGLSNITQERPFVTTLWHNLLNLPSLWSGSLGTSGLGWVDTGMPAVVGVGMVALCGGLAFWGLARVDRYTLLAAAVAGSSIAIIPLVVLNADRNIVGENIQPRYLLPMLPIILGYLLLEVSNGESAKLSRAQRSAMVAILVIAQSAALHANIRRYVTGQDELGLNLNNAEWWWSIGPTPMMVWIAGSVSFAGCVVIGLRYCGESPSSPPAAFTPISDPAVTDPST